ncbi:hypothetical protein VN12_04160 [Pirellula sp. SH-Sr6A]|uniref:hypothetical protein n=1 Tax=Pirellula sp. SH-Sr6A TaxID=1632865 RepID=UPI00078B80C3|nr:hypothetical protein [Pirellula sp. SH-Sr6A]AMV31286.1 hypothetical protein VN12_04160 [Pirellula sp. SH-Sr6A]
MNQQEISEFWGQVFINFPSLEEWINTKSPDPPKTIASWSRAWENITAKEAMSVLNRWVTGEIDPPTGYQRETFHIHLRQVVMSDRAKLSGARAREEAFEKANIGAARPKIMVSCSAVMDKIIALKSQYEAGFISMDELERERDLIVREAHEEIDNNAKRKAV